MVDIDATRDFYDFNIPMEYVRQLQQIKATPIVGATFGRQWISESRRMDDPTWDIITVNFRSPVAISQISFDLHEIRQDFEFWYYSTQNKRLPILDTFLRHYIGSINTGDIYSWYTFTQDIYPIVATSVELRIRRVVDSYVNPRDSYPVTVRNLLFKRTIYSRTDAIQSFPTEIDPIGNVVERFVNDWDAPQAIDGNATTFWKSSPQPSPNAVVNFYIDCRDGAGNAQRIDRLYLNPTHTGQNINLYYSNDDALGQRSLALTFLPPSSTNNAPQVPGSGLDLSQTNAFYTVSSATLGLVAGQSMWIGGVWQPNFDSNSPPPTDLVLFSDRADDIHIKYRALVGEIEIKWGTVTHFISISSFSAGTPLAFAFRIIFPNDPSGVAAGLYFDMMTPWGSIYANFYTSLTPDVVDLTTFFTFGYSAGYLQQIFIKQEGVTGNQVFAALQDVPVYVNPGSSPSSIFFSSTSTQGLVPTSGVSNMVYGADFTQNEEGYGGVDHNAFTMKQWTPMFVDWTANKGYMYFPQPIVCKYINLEFSGLTEEPYPIYETGIEVEYQSFPINVVKTSVSILQQQTDTTTSSRTQTSSLYGSIYNNYYSNTTFTQRTTNLPQDIDITVGKGTLGNTPQVYNTAPSTVVSRETTSSTFYSGSSSTNVQNIAQSVYYTVVSGDYLIKIGQEFGVPWQAIYAANEQEIATDPRVALLPQRSPGWWIFPGEVLRIPAAIMNQITTTSTTTEKKVSSTTTTTTRTRFSLTQVHQYDVRTAIRDAAIAYFAGINEIQLFRLDYTAVDDTQSYKFPQYDAVAFSLSNMQQYSTGAWAPLDQSTQNNANLLGNPSFEGTTIGWGVARSNFSPNPSFATGITGYSVRTFSGPAITSLSWITSGGYIGANYLGATASASGAGGIQFPTTTGPQFGQPFTVSCYVQSSAVVNAQLMMSFLNYSNGIISTITGAVTSLAAGVGDWQRISVMGVAPLGATQIAPYLVFSGLSSGQTVGVDGVMHVVSPDVDIYSENSNSTISLVSNAPAPIIAAGTECGQVISTGQGSNGIQSYLTSVQANTPLTFSAYVNPSVTQNVILYLQWYDNFGSYQSEFSSMTVGVPGGVWTRISASTTVPSYIRNVIAQVVGISTAASQTLNNDAVLLEVSPSLNSYDNSFFVPGKIVSQIWPSMSYFYQVQMSVQDRGLIQAIPGTTLIPVISGTDHTAYWDDPVATWDDPVATWGSELDLVEVDLDSLLVFAGKNAAHFSRLAGAGQGEIATPSFLVQANSRIRMNIDFFLPNSTETNPLTLQLFDTSTSSVLFSQNIPLTTFGQWSSYSSLFWTNGPTDRTSVIIRLLIGGTAASDIYIARIFPQSTTIVYELSNDGGSTWYEVTEAVRNPGSYFVFPSMNNQLEMRTTLYQPTDYVYGFSLTPTYVQY